MSLYRNRSNLTTIGILLLLVLGSPLAFAQTFGPTGVLNTNAGTDGGQDEFPQVTTDGAGNWIAVWQSSDSLGDSIGTDIDILVARSTDNGATWSAPAALNTNAALDAGHDEWPQVTTDGAGNWLAAWQSRDSLGDTIGTDLDILLARSMDAGTTWSTPVALNTNASTDTGNDEDPQLATDGAGNWVAVWESDDSLGGTIGFDGDILVARSTDNGATWTDPTPLNSDAAIDPGFFDGWPQVTADGVGNWVVVWNNNPLGLDPLGSSHILVAHSTDAGATWSASTVHNSPVGHIRNLRPQVATDGVGNWLAVWYSQDSLGGTIGGDFDILVARSTDIGVTWSAAQALNANADNEVGHDGLPQVTTDGAGNWVAVWYSDNSLGSLGWDFDVLMARSTDNGLTWSDPAALNMDLATDSERDDWPQLTTDGAGNWVAVWESIDTLGGTVGDDFDIFFAAGTGPDTDGDGLSDGAEVKIHGTDPLLPDTDGDGLNDGAEVDVHGTDPLVTDTDSDGLNDGAEVNLHGTNPLVTDTDGDGLGDGVEVNVHGTNPLLADTDGDGLNDEVEVNVHGTNPLAYDSDGDGLGDGAELSVHGTQPLVPDTDGDGLTDGDEVNVHGTEPLVTDTDGDGFSDGDEVGAGSDPKDTSSTPLTILSFGPVGALNTNAGSDSAIDSRPEVATDGAGNWLAVWESNDPSGEIFGTDSDIFVARSADNGATWSAPAALNSNAGTDTGDDLRPHLAADGAGNWVAVWESDDSLGGTIGTLFDVFVARSTDDGVSWSSPEVLNTNVSVDTETHWKPRVATDGAGLWLAVWESDDTLGGTTGADRDILMARSTDNGATWSVSAALNTNAGSDTDDDFVPELATDGAGNWVVVWTSRDTLGGTIGMDFDSLVACSTDHGVTWTAPAALNTNAAVDTGGDFRPQVTTDRAGLWVAVWYSVDTLGGILGGDSDALVTRSTDAGATWSFPAALNTNAVIDTGDDRRVRAITDGVGNWIAIWESDDTLRGNLGGDSDVLMARSADGGLTWRFPAPLNANAGSDAGDDLRPRLATDGAGHWVAVWYSDDALGGTAGDDEADIFHATGTGPDTDGDGLSDGADCAPSDGQTWDIPGEVTHLSLTHAGGAAGTTTLSWTEPDRLGGVAIVYDTVSAAGASHFTTGTCEESNDGSDTLAESTTSVTPGQVLCFLVRAGNGCSEGDSGTDSALNLRNVVACP